MASYSKAIHSQMAYPASIVHVYSYSIISPVPHNLMLERNNELHLTLNSQ